MTGKPFDCSEAGIHIERHANFDTKPAPIAKKDDSIADLADAKWNPVTNTWVHPDGTQSWIAE